MSPFSTGNPTLDSVLAILGALSVILTVVANMPAVAPTKVGRVLLKLTAVDFVGLVRAAAAFMPKSAPKDPPADK